MSVPCPTVMFEKIDSSKFKETHREDPVINFEAEGGWVLTRPRYTRRPPVQYTLGFTNLSDEQKQAIEQLYNDARGSAEIITGWVHPVSKQSIPVRFKKGSVPKYTYRGKGGTHRWDVADIVLEEV